MLAVSAGVMRVAAHALGLHADHGRMPVRVTSALADEHDADVEAAQQVWKSYHLTKKGGRALLSIVTAGVNIYADSPLPVCSWVQSRALLPEWVREHDARGSPVLVFHTLSDGRVPTAVYPSVATASMASAGSNGAGSESAEHLSDGLVAADASGAAVSGDRPSSAHEELLSGRIRRHPVGMEYDNDHDTAVEEKDGNNGAASHDGAVVDGDSDGDDGFRRSHRKKKPRK